jgi:very-short-patch-repair endonuclease
MKIKGEKAVELILAGHGVKFEREYRFNSARKWRFDFCIVDYKIAIEVEGGSWVGGRHNRPIGFSKDCLKYNSATILGWRVLRYTSDIIKNNPGSIFDDILMIINKDKKHEK